MTCCREPDQREMVSGVDVAGHKVGRSRRSPKISTSDRTHARNRNAKAPHSCQGAVILCPFRAISKMHQAKFYCITRCVALKRTRATFPCAAPRHNSSPSRCAARADLAEISRRTRAVIF